MKKWLWIMLILINSSANAAIYTQTEGNGTTLYSDVPLSSNAKEVEVSTGAQISSNPNPPSESMILPQPAKASYTSFAITSPADKGTIQNQPDIIVQLKTEPELKKGDTIQVSLDGKPVGKPEHGMTFHLGLVERGEHTVSATLYDAKQTVIKQTGPITIFVHRASVNQPANSQAAS